METKSPNETEPGPDVIRAQREKILESAIFSNSPRMARFLNFATDRALSGQGETLKEFAIGVEVFDKRASFDPRVDSIVRVEARRLRRKLKQYYSTLGKQDPVLIELPEGSYVPRFRWRQPDIAVELQDQLRAGSLLSGNMVAVLPFATFSADRETRQFCDGLTDEVASAFTKLLRMRVAPRRSTLQFKGKSHDVQEIGARLNVSMVLEGSVRRSGDRLRITVHLVSVEHGFTVWSDTYERGLRDPFAVQEEIARAVTRDLVAHLGLSSEAMRKSGTLEARKRYLTGRHYWGRLTENCLKRAIECFRQAAAEDPLFAQAYAGLADSYVALAAGTHLSCDQALPLALKSVTKALDADNRAAAAYASRGFIRSLQQWDWRAAEEDFLHALDLDSACVPAHAGYAVTCLAPLGRLAEGISRLRRAQEFDPVSPLVASCVGLLHYLDMEYDQAVRELERAIELDEHLWWSHFLLGLACERAGLPADAERAMERAQALAAGNTQATLGLSYVRASAGALTGAELLENGTKRPAKDPFWLAAIQAVMGNADQALGWLAEAVEARSSWLVFLKVFPPFAELRSDPAFLDLLRALSLDSRTASSGT